EILIDHPHHAQDFTLPWRQPRGGLLQEVEEGFFRQAKQRLAPRIVVRAGLALALRHRAPEIVEQLLTVAAALFSTLLLRAQIRHALAREAMDAVALQRMRRIQHALYFFLAVAILELCDQAACKL